MNKSDNVPQSVKSSSSEENAIDGRGSLSQSAEMMVAESANQLGVAVDCSPGALNATGAIDKLFYELEVLDGDLR